VVVFCFWITHVPVERLDQFLGRVANALVPGGSVFFIDNRRGRISLDVAVLGQGGNRVPVRRLSDGREYRIIKNYFAGPAQRGLAIGLRWCLVMRRAGQFRREPQTPASRSV
jgi:demethylmenaquinone methyltransferase/2-methoxy-6-polyprenyl-1,4-benzoquinol methylase